MPIRLPVTMNRRWLQIDGLGCGRRARREDERPQRVGVRLQAGIHGVDARERVVERLAQARFGVVAVGEAGGDEQVVGLGG